MIRPDAAWWKCDNREQRLVDMIDNQRLKFAQAAKQLSTLQHPISKNAAIGKYKRLKAPKKPKKLAKPKNKCEPTLYAIPTGCRWPIGDPSDPDFHYCNKPEAFLRPYCPEHFAMAHINPKGTDQ